MNLSELKRIEKEVEKSFNRCLYKQSPQLSDFSHAIVKKDEELRQLMKKNSILISVFKNSIIKIRETLDNGYIFFLTDNNGVLLKYFCKNELKKKLKEKKLYPGVSFKEEQLGSNAIGMAMILNKTVYLLPEHHYYQLLKNWYCYAIPLRKGDNIMGYLDISTLNNKLGNELVTIANLLCDLILIELDKYKSFEISGVKLTKIQRKILELLAIGDTEANAAKKLERSVDTIKYHKQEIYEKMEVNNICQALTKAFCLGILKKEDLYQKM